MIRNISNNKRFQNITVMTAPYPITATDIIDYSEISRMKQMT